MFGRYQFEWRIIDTVVIVATSFVRWWFSISNRNTWPNLVIRFSSLCSFCWIGPARFPKTIATTINSVTERIAELLYLIFRVQFVVPLIVAVNCTGIAQAAPSWTLIANLQQGEITTHHLGLGVGDEENSIFFTIVFRRQRINMKPNDAGVQGCEKAALAGGCLMNDQ